MAVRVVAAGVHDAGVTGAVGRVVGLDDGQGVHVGADGDQRAVVAQVGHNPCLADAGADTVAADLGQRIGHQGRGLKLLEAEFGVGVNDAPQADHLITERLGFV
jgi:hypothetical protein